MRRLAARYSIMGMAILCFLILFMAGNAEAVPNTLNYQGYLTDTQGQPIRTPKNITVRLYNTSSGGAAFWSEPYSNVPINNGRFSLVLGSTPANPLDTTKFTGETYIGIQVESESEMAPRQKLTSVAYALVADTVSIIPAGSIMMYGGSTAPAGWLIGDGSSLAREGTYARLFTAIGTAFGAADGTHFNLPDCRGRTLMGAGSGPGLTLRDLGDKPGEETHTLIPSELAAHSHSITDPGHTHWSAAGIANQGWGAPMVYNVLHANGTWIMHAGGSPSYSFPVMNNPTNITATNYEGSGTPHNTVQPNLVVSCIIKY